jgi:hypothetical protein
LLERNSNGAIPIDLDNYVYAVDGIDNVYDPRHDVDDFFDSLIDDDGVVLIEFNDDGSIDLPAGLYYIAAADGKHITAVYDPNYRLLAKRNDPDDPAGDRHGS